MVELCRQFEVKKLKGEATAHTVSLQSEKIDFEKMYEMLKGMRKEESKVGQVDASTHRDKESKRENYQNVHSDEFSPASQGFKSHPYLESPRYDGMTDPVVNPDPRINPQSEEAARNEYQNELRPGNRPRFNPRPL